MQYIKRAISDEEKQQRVQNIISSTEKLFLNGNYKDITLSKIAHDTGLAKGTLFLYFQTKEELFLSLAEQVISQWSYSIQIKMQDIIISKRKLLINEFIEMLINSIDNGIFMKLLSILDDTLEQNIDLDRAFRFKTFLKGELSEIGKLIEAVLPVIHEGHGIMMLQQLFICLVGAYKVSSPSLIVKQAIQRPGLEIFNRDFIETAKDMVTYHINGYIAIHQKE